MIVWTWLVPAASALAPDPFATCDEQHGYYETQLRPRPGEDRPVLWWIETHACPVGSTLAGTGPPSGRWVACQDARGRGLGWRTEFGVDGKVLLETSWDRNQEVGPRREWDPVTYDLLRLTPFRDGQPDGEAAEWLADGGVLVTTYRRGLREGPTWQLDDRGGLVMVESWHQNERHGRSCTWRDDHLPIEQVYTAGKPTTE